MRIAVTFRSPVLCSICSIGMFSLALLASAQQPAQEKPVPDSRFWDASLLSKPTYGVRTLFNVLIPMRDGVRLSVDLYLPDAPGQFPTLLWRTPYSNNSAGEVAQGRWYASRGYAVVKADVRGKYDSEGEPYTYK